MGLRWDEEPDGLYERREDYGQHVGCDTYADLTLDDLLAEPPSLTEMVAELVLKYAQPVQAFVDQDGQTVVSFEGRTVA